MQSARAIRPVVPVIAFNEDREVPVYAMFDTAATGAAGLDEIAYALGLELSSEPTQLATFNSYQREVHDFASFKIRSLDGATELDVKEAIIGTLLTTERDVPPKNSDISHLDYMHDVHFDELESAKIGIILDVSFAWAFSPLEQRTGAESQPVAWLTAFGWTLLGKFDQPADISERGTDMCMLDIEEMTIQDQINTMFRRDFIMNQQEWCPSEMIHPSKEDQNSLKIMEESIKENESTGHYSVALPWIHGREKAAEILNSVDSYANAHSRLMKEKRRLQHDPVRKAAVFKQFQKMLDDGHSRPVDPEMSTEGQVVWYMPSHIVPPPPDKPDKWRACLDAASKVKGVSLNSQLGGGPDGLNSLVGILLRWREQPVVLTGDVTAFFFMIETDDADISAFRYLWFKDETMEEVRELESNVQIFGARSSPPIAAFTLKYHAARIRERYGDEVFYCLVNQMYVDDLITSFPTITIAKEMRRKIVNALAEGGMTLCKLNSNYPEVLIDNASSPPSQIDNSVANGKQDAAATTSGKTDTEGHRNATVPKSVVTEDITTFGRDARPSTTEENESNESKTAAEIAEEDELESDFDDTKTSITDLIQNTFHNETFADATKMFIQPKHTSGKVLGVGYCHETDTVFVRGTERARREIRTLRQILSFIAAIFDPMGHFCAVILRARLEFQKFVALGYDWNDIIPADELKPFLEWMDSIAGLANITISRWTSELAYKDAETSLIVFSDSSKEGYGMVAYIRRAIDKNSVALVRQVYGKARVVPLNFHERKIPCQEENPSESMPKLELEAARLACLAQDMLNRESRETYQRTMLFTDSHTVLQWLLSFRKKFKTYEFHRVNKIRDLTDVQTQWNYVASAENPADLCSHGFLGNDMEKHHFFFQGPTWLTGPESQWPPHRPEEVLPATKQVDIAAISAVARFSPIELLATAASPLLDETEPFDETIPFVKLRLASKHGSWKHKVNSIARFQRKYRQLCVFNKNKKHGIKLTKEDFQMELIDSYEFESAENDLIRAIQFKYYGKEMRQLLKLGVTSPDSHSELRCKTNLVSLNPFLDETTSLRVGGRIRNSLTLSYDAMFPRILPGYDEDVKSLIRYTHEKLIHATINHTFHTLRAKFHIVGGRNCVNNTLKKCMPCQKREKRPQIQKLGDLPGSRTNYIRPFRTTAADLTGDYKVKIPGSRASHKRYILMCCCMTSRAVCLLPLRDLTTGVLINALTKLVNTYPGVEVIHSDCGTNFVGAQRENLRATAEWNDAQIQDELVVQGVKWETSPPHAHFYGGVYERLIRSTKKHLRFLFTQEPLDLEVFETSLSRVSAVLNSRPLSYASNCVDDYRVLSPNSFLYPHVITPAWATISPPIPVTGDYLRSSWRDVRRLVTIFEDLWYKDYLQSLKPLAKWRKSVPNLFVGQLVIMQDDKLPRHQWKMARVDSIISEGSHVRRVKITTADRRTYERHVNTVIPMEVDGEETSE